MSGAPVALPNMSTMPASRFLAIWSVAFSTSGNCSISDARLRRQRIHRAGTSGGSTLRPSVRASSRKPTTLSVLSMSDDSTAAMNSAG
jgi:hypothetical protein